MSDYFKRLSTEDPEVANRYKQKISVIGNVDPFALKTVEFSTEAAKFPPVTNMDIVAYLVLTTSYYTKEQMKAFKSLSAFKYFEAGFVSGCGALEMGDYTILIGKMKHSQRMNSPPLQVWVTCQSSGSVVTSHCTCMAGLGEVCSHIGALLYAVEYIVTERNTTSCTDVKALWKIPGVSKVEYTAMRDIAFGRVIPSKPTTVHEAFTMTEIKGYLCKIEESGSFASIIRVLEPFATAVASSLEGEATYVQNLYALLYNKEYEAFSLEDLLAAAANIKVEVSEEDCQKIREGTSDQSKSKEWFMHRAGRITASNFKASVRTSLSKPSLTLIKKICCPLGFQLNIKSLKWGLDHEKDAIRAYQHEQNLYHENLQITSIGLCINHEMPYFGASPDGMVPCSCCGQGCIEVKCPYTLIDKSFEDFCRLKDSCLVFCGENIMLDRTHAYHYQIQQQMAVTKTLYCDFLIWSPKDLYIERVPFNEDFWASESQKSLTFHRKVIMPELLGKYYTRTTSVVPTYCTSNSVDDQRPMIACDSENCKISWYHMDCLGMTDVPLRSPWYCPNCFQTCRLDQ